MGEDEEEVNFEPDDVSEEEEEAEVADVDAEVDADVDTDPNSGDSMTNFMSKERLRQMNEKFLKDEAELPYNSEMWIYSDWAYLDFAPQYSTTWWWTWAIQWMAVVLNGWRFFSAIDGKFYYYNMGRNLSVWLL